MKLEKTERSVAILAVIGILIICLKVLSFTTGQLAVIGAVAVLKWAIDAWRDIQKMKVEEDYMIRGAGKQCKHDECINYEPKVEKKEE